MQEGKNGRQEKEYIYELVKDNPEFKRDLLHCFAKFALVADDMWEIIDYKELVSFLFHYEVKPDEQ